MQPAQGGAPTSARTKAASSTTWTLRLQPSGKVKATRSYRELGSTAGSTAGNTAAGTGTTAAALLVLPLEVMLAALVVVLLLVLLVVRAADGSAGRTFCCWD